MIDLVCVAANIFNLVTELLVSPCMGEEGHRLICVNFAGAGAAPAAAPAPRVRVCRPQGLSGLDDLPECCGPAVEACLLV